MADPDVIAMPERKPLPASIEVAANATEGFSPNELKAIKAASGLRLDYLLQEADWDEKSQLAVWIALRRAGYDPTWEEAGNVRPLTPTEPEPPDPTSSAPSTGSPPSAGFGAAPRGTSTS
jgi:hypothetical protein